MTRDVVDEMLAAIETGRGGDLDVFTPDVVWDATVPDWRYQVRGERAVREKFAEWFGTPARLSGVRRRTTTDGDDILEIEAQIDDHGSPVWSHVLLLLERRDERVARVTVFCGGSWTAERMAEMAAAQAAADSAAEVPT